MTYSYSGITFNEKAEDLTCENKQEYKDIKFQKNILNIKNMEIIICFILIKILIKKWYHFILIRYIITKKEHPEQNENENNESKATLIIVIIFIVLLIIILCAVFLIIHRKRQKAFSNIIDEVSFPLKEQ